MATDEEIKKQLLKQSLRRARITSIILGGAFVVAVISLIFGLTQSIEADRNLEKSIANEKIALFHKTEADKQRDIANEQTALALQTKKELEAMIMELEKALMDCRKKK